MLEDQELLSILHPYFNEIVQKYSGEIMTEEIRASILKEVTTLTSYLLERITTEVNDSVDVKIDDNGVLSITLPTWCNSYLDEGLREDYDKQEDKS